jgi:hypothetical protein
LSPAQIKNIRKQFEAWLRRTRPKGPSLEYYENEGYFDDKTQLAWEAWQISWITAYQSGQKIGRNQIVFGRKRR